MVSNSDTDARFRLGRDAGEDPCGEETSMPRQLFDDVVEPTIRVGTRQWYTVPLSMISHVAVLGVLVAAPIVATHALPTPDSVVIFLSPPPLPEPPTPMTPAPAPRV